MYTSIRELKHLLYDFKRDFLVHKRSEELIPLLSKIIDKLEEIDGRLEELEDLIK